MPALTGLTSKQTLFIPKMREHERLFAISGWEKLCMNNVTTSLNVMVRDNVRAGGYMETLVDSYNQNESGEGNVRHQLDEHISS